MKPLIFILLLVPLVAQASGFSLLQNCETAIRLIDSSEDGTANANFAYGHCVGLVEGVRDTLNLTKRSRVCFAENGTYQDVHSVVDYLKAHPGHYQRTDAEVAVLALEEVYPCLK